MKKLVLAVGTLVALASCSFNPFVSSNTPSEELPTLILNNDYGVKTAAAASLLTDALSGSQNGALAARKDRRLSEAEELEAIDKVHAYLGMMNQLLTENPIQTELVESDREEYAFKSIVTTIGLDGTTSVFTLYFNGVVEDDTTSSSSEVTSSEVTSEESSVESSIEESSVSSEVVEESSSSEVLDPSSEPQARDDEEEDDEDEDEEDEEEREDIDDDYENEDETEDDIDDEDKDEYRDYQDRELGEETDEGDITALTGLAVVGELEYQLIGFTKTEDGEVKTKYFLSLDENNWIKIATETEIDESEYKVIMKVDGEVSKMAFEIETENDETEIKLFIKSETGAPEMYKFKSQLHEETGGQLIRIKARVGQDKFNAVVLIYTDENGEVIYNYRFEGSTRDYDRDGERDYHDHHNDRDDD